MQTNKEKQSNYLKYRGKCKEFSEEEIKKDPTLTLVRGHYYCPVFGEQPHWWCIKPDGTIIDPTALQFPSEGKGTYVPLEEDFTVECTECGKELKENEIYGFASNYIFCSCACYMRCVGL